MVTIGLPECVYVQGYRSIRATQSVNAGLWFYEVKILDVSSSDGHLRLVAQVRQIRSSICSITLFDGWEISMAA